MLELTAYLSSEQLADVEAALSSGVTGGRIRPTYKSHPTHLGWQRMDVVYSVDDAANMVVLLPVNLPIVWNVTIDDTMDSFEVAIPDAGCFQVADSSRITITGTSTGRMRPGEQVILDELRVTLVVL